MICFASASVRNQFVSRHFWSRLGLENNDFVVVQEERTKTRFWTKTSIRRGSMKPGLIKWIWRDLRSLPKHDIGIIGIGQDAIVAAIDWTTLCKFQAENRLEAGGHKGIGKAKHDVLDDQQTIGFECSSEIGHGLLEVGEVYAVVALRRRR